VQTHVADLVARDQPRRAYVCGLSPMVDSVVEALRAAGVAGNAIRYERFDA